MDLHIIPESDGAYSIIIYIENFLENTEYNQAINNLKNIEDWKTGDRDGHVINRVQKWYHVDKQPFSKNWRYEWPRWESHYYDNWLLKFQDKVSEKLLGVLAGIDQQVSSLAKGEVADRIRQEIVLYGVKIDIDEEISRLKIHIQAIRNALQKGGPVGKRLDFLMQELQRESNTLGAKSVSQETSDAAIELKLLVEQIREQVQNLE